MKGGTSSLVISSRETLSILDSLSDFKITPPLAQLGQQPDPSSCVLQNQQTKQQLSQQQQTCQIEGQVLTLVLEVAGGVDQLIIEKESEIESKAAEFCLKHNYQRSCVGLFVEQIRQQIQLLLTETKTNSKQISGVVEDKQTAAKTYEGHINIGKNENEKNLMENIKSNCNNINNQLDPSKSSREGKSISTSVSPTRVKDQRVDSTTVAAEKSIFKVEDSQEGVLSELYFQKQREQFNKEQVNSNNVSNSNNPFSSPFKQYSYKASTLNRQPSNNPNLAHETSISHSNTLQSPNPRAGVYPNTINSPNGLQLENSTNINLSDVLLTCPSPGVGLKKTMKRWQRNNVSTSPQPGRTNTSKESFSLWSEQTPTNKAMTRADSQNSLLQERRNLVKLSKAESSANLSKQQEIQMRNLLTIQANMHEQEGKQQILEIGQEQKQLWNGGSQNQQGDIFRFYQEDDVEDKNIIKEDREEVKNKKRSRSAMLGGNNNINTTNKECKDIVKNDNCSPITVKTAQRQYQPKQLLKTPEKSQQKGKTQQQQQQPDREKSVTTHSSNRLEVLVTPSRKKDCGVIHQENSTNHIKLKRDKSPVQQPQAKTNKSNGITAKNGNNSQISKQIKPVVGISITPTKSPLRERLDSNNKKLTIHDRLYNEAKKDLLKKEHWQQQISRIFTKTGFQKKLSVKITDTSSGAANTNVKVPTAAITISNKDHLVSYPDQIQQGCEYTVYKTTLSPFKNNIEKKMQCQNVGIKSHINLTTPKRQPQQKQQQQQQTEQVTMIKQQGQIHQQSQSNIIAQSDNQHPHFHLNTQSVCSDNNINNNSNSHESDPSEHARLLREQQELLLKYAISIDTDNTDNERKPTQLFSDQLKKQIHYGKDIMNVLDKPQISNIYGCSSISTMSTNDNTCGSYPRTISPLPSSQKNIKQKECLQSQQHSDRLQKTITSIFNLLDSDNDGYITASAIDLSKLNSQILMQLSEVLMEIERFNRPIDLAVFEMLVKQHPKLPEQLLEFIFNTNSTTSTIDNNSYYLGEVNHLNRMKNIHNNKNNNCFQQSSNVQPQGSNSNYQHYQNVLSYGSSHQQHFENQTNDNFRTSTFQDSISVHAKPSQIADEGNQISQANYGSYLMDQHIISGNHDTNMLTNESLSAQDYSRQIYSDKKANNLIEQQRLQQQKKSNSSRNGNNGQNILNIHGYIEEQQQQHQEVAQGQQFGQNNDRWKRKQLAVSGLEFEINKPLGDFSPAFGNMDDHKSSHQISSSNLLMNHSHSNSKAIQPQKINLNGFY